MTERRWFISFLIALAVAMALICEAVILGGFTVMSLIQDQCEQELAEKYPGAMVTAANAMLNMRKIGQAGIPLQNWISIPQGVSALVKAMEEYPPRSGKVYEGDEQAVEDLTGKFCRDFGMEEGEGDIRSFLHHLRNFLRSAMIPPLEATGEVKEQELIDKNEKFIDRLGEIISSKKEKRTP